MDLTTQERDARYRRIRATMAAENLDVLLISGKGHGWTGRGYFRYMTDFHLWGHDGLILFSATEEEPMLTLTSGGVAQKISERGWVEDARGDWDLALGIIDELRQRGLDRARIGLVGRDMILPVGVYERLREGLPAAEFVDADALMDRIRAVKSPREIEQIRGLWEIATGAMERFVSDLEPDRSELQLSGGPVRFIHERGARDYLIFIDGRLPSDRIVELRGTIKYHMEICGPSGHWCEITVLPTFGDVPAERARLMRAELEGYRQVREVARPGATLNRLADVYEGVLLDAGFQIDRDGPGHHYDFHGQGLDWIEWPTRAPNDPDRFDTPLEEGMYINYHPSRTLSPPIPSGGINDGMVVTAEGGRRIHPDWNMDFRLLG